MKKLLFIMVLIISLLLISCSEKDDNPTDVNVYGYKLDQFITQATVNQLITSDTTDENDYRYLFAYEIVSDDAEPWSPRQSSNTSSDLKWESFKEGFYIPSDNKKTWFADPSLPNAFKVKNAKTFKLYRKVDIVTTRSSKHAELHSLTKHTVNNWNSTPQPEEAIKLSDLLTGIASYTSVKLVAGDGYSVEYTPEQIADGYYLLTSEVTTFPNLNSTMTGSQKKFKRLARLEVTTTDEQDHIFGYADQATANTSFTIPNDLSAYTKTVMVDY